MKLTAADATRILSFCLDRRYEVELAEQGRTCFMKISPLNRAAPARCFEADSFEQILRVAAEAGVVRKECIERQIAFCQTIDARSILPRTEEPKPPAKPAGAVEVPPEAAAVSAAHYIGLAELRYQMRRFDSLSEGAARAAGLETSQHQVLLTVAGLPATRRATVATVAQRMCMEVDRCQELADLLVDRGLVRWTTNPADRRERILTLTTAGETTLSRLTSLDRLQILTLGPRLVQALGTILSSREE